MSARSIYLLVTVLFRAVPSFAQEKDVTSTVTWNLAAGDSIVIFESRIGEYTPGQTPFPSHSPAKTYSRTSKYVIKKNGNDFTLACYVSDRDRSPNYKFDRVMKKEGYWHFKKYIEKQLTPDEVKLLCLFEKNCTDHPLDRYDEGDISRTMTVIKHSSKEVCSSYQAALVMDAIVMKK